MPQTRPRVTVIAGMLALAALPAMTVTVPGWRERHVQKTGEAIDS